MKLIAIICGAAIGASGRYFLSGWISSSARANFPWGTLAVNLLGCLVIGLLWGMGEKADWSPLIRSFLFIGILGSFTTFSSFGLETAHLLMADMSGSALIYVATSNLGGFAMVWAGITAGSAGS